MSYRDISSEPLLQAGRRRHIVILALDTLGDLVLRQPLFTGLLDDGHRVTVVVRRGYDEIISYLDRRLRVAVTEVNPYPSPDAETWAGLRALTARLKKLEPDVIISDVFDRTYADEWLLQQFPACEQIGLVNPDRLESPLETLPPSATRPPERSGPVPLTRGVACERDEHEADKHGRLFEALTGRKLAHCDPVIVVGEDVRARAAKTARDLGLEPGRFAAGCPAGTANVLLKTWPAEDFVVLAAHLGARHGLPVLLIGSTDELDHLKEVSRVALTRGLRMPIWTGGPGDLGLLLGLLSLSRVYMGNDTGPMHFAAAVGTPVIARFGGGHWPRFLPRAGRAFSATQQLPCFGCAWGCWLDDAACMEFVDHETWIHGVDWVLSGTTAERRIDAGPPLDERLTAVFVSGMNARRRLKNELETQIHQLTRWLTEVNAGPRAQLSTINRLTERLAESDADRAARLDQIHELTRRLAESDADRTARLDQIHDLTRRLTESDADRAARLDQIHTLTRMVHQLQREPARTQEPKDTQNTEPDTSDASARGHRRSLRLAVNVRTLHPGKIGGLEEAFRQLLDALLRTGGSALKVTLFTSEESASSFAEWRERVQVRTLPENGWMAALMEAVPAYDVLWCPLFFLEPSPPPIPAVVTIPDLQHETFPQFFTPELLALRLRACRESARYSHRVLTLSQYSKRDLVRLYHLPEDHVQVVPLDCAPEYRRLRDEERVRSLRARFGLQADYGLFPANTWPHKNHRGLFQALAQYRRDYGNPPQIVLTGAKVEGGIDLDREIRDAGLSDLVRYLGYVDREDMPDLYDGARFLVFVSLFEGFGIPLIEAMHRGTPIIASSTTSVPEVAADCALLVDPCDPAAIASAIHAVLHEPDSARERAARGRHRAERFSYDASAEIVWRTLQGAASMPAQPPAAKAPGAQPKVFVVTPSFNQGRFLRETIDSVLRQDYPNLEYFVADGGSSDDSVEILRSYGNRVRWTSAPDGGQSAAIAKAWEQSDAEIVAWLNSDDTYLDGAVTAAVDYLFTHPEMAMVYGNAWYIDAQGKRLEPYPTKPFDRTALAGECFICQPAAFVRREVFKVIHLPDPSLHYCMDYDLWIRLSRYFRIGYFERFLATSRLHADTKTLGQRSGVFREIMEVARRHYSFVHRSWVLGYVYYRWTRIAGRFWFLPMPIRRRFYGLLANRMQARLEGSPYEDGWVGRRTLLTVVPDATGRVTIDCESPVWSFRRRLRIKVSYDGRLLATRSAVGPGRFTLTFQLPPNVGRQPTVLLEANRSFVPFRRGISTDQRALSFRILRSGSETPADGETGLMSALASHLPAAGSDLR